MKFLYQAKNKEGKVVKGQVEATSRESAASAILKLSLIPILIEPKPGEGLSIFLATYFKVGLPSLENIMMFCRQMASLTRAGVPLVRSIRVVMITTHNKMLKDALEDVLTNLESGVNLATSLERYPLVFSTLMVSLVRVGENTGSLDEVFRQLAMHFERETDTRKKIKAAIRYPITVLVVISIAIGVINVVVIPAFSAFFKQFKSVLPLPTRILIAASDFTVNYWYLVLIGLLLTFMFLVYLVNSPEGEMVYDRLKLRIPLVGGIIKKALLARFARMFALCMKTGVPLLQSIQLIARSADNVFIYKKIVGMRADIERGESLTTAANNTGMFTELVLQMMLIGEETGEIDKLFDEVAHFYEEEVDYQVSRLGASIEPVLIVCIGGIVLILALGVFLPMWNLSQVAMSR